MDSCHLKGEPEEAPLCAVMKRGVIFYFVSLDPLEITHSILKEHIFQLSEMRDLLAPGKGKKTHLPFPFACFLVPICFNTQLIIQLHGAFWVACFVDRLEHVF